ncbi:MAG: ABC transporter permease subunit [Pirellulales bacterium]|nr:ABC transporter permease subunit [Pirellulales bacterium]
MSRALWKKAIRAAWLQLLVSSLLLILFGWTFVWLMGMFKLGAWSGFLKMLPDFTRRMLGTPVAQLATPEGQISVLYVHVVTILLCLGWAIGRGSDAISGEISRGTMDLTMSLPVRRTSVLLIPAVVAALGAVILAASVLLGNWLGLVLARPGENLSVDTFLPGAVNLAALTFALTGITAFVSSWNRSRWRAISIVVGFYIASLIVQMVSRVWQPGAWLGYLSFLSAYEPQRLILDHEQTWSLSLWYNGTLLGLGLIGYFAAAVIFSHRDIPSAY